MAVRILILERHALYGEALTSRLLDAKMDVVAVISTGRDAIEFLERDQADVILIGLDLADSRVNLMKRRPRKSDGLMSEWDDAEVIDGALKAGFRGYLSRAAPFAEFVMAIQAIVDGGTVFPKTFSGDELDKHPDMTVLLSTLTRQEREILGFLVEGLDARTIARRLGISSREAGDQRRALLRKLNPRQGSTRDYAAVRGVWSRGTSAQLRETEHAARRGRGAVAVPA